MVFRVSKSCPILIAKTGLPWGNLTSLLGEMACIAWQNLRCCRWFTARFVKYSHPEEIPLFGPFPCLSLPTVHTTRRHTHMKRHWWEVRRTGPSGRALLTYHTHFALVVSAHHGLQKHCKRPLWCVESLAVMGPLTALLS